MKKFTLALFIFTISFLSVNAQTKVLYYCDFVAGFDQMDIALTNQGCNVTYVFTDTDFQTEIATPANYDIAIYFCQSILPDAASVNALVNFISLGKTGMYSDWTNNAALGALAGVSYTMNINQNNVLVTDPQLANGLLPNPFLLTDPGWGGIYSWGMNPLPGSVTQANYTGNGEPSIIKSLGGHMLVFGFMNDLFPTPELYENAIMMLTPTITTTPLSGTFCEGNSLSVDYTVFGGFNPGNVFTAQLSDASGSFATPVDIGTFASTTSGTINCTIPLLTSAGTGYRVRVVSSSPVVNGTDNQNDLTVNSIPVVTCPSDIVVGNDAGVCGAIVNYSESFTGTPAPVLSYSQASGTFFPLGTTAVTITATNSCGSGNCTFNITVNDTEKPVITCPGDISINNDPGVCGATTNYSVTATDNCMTLVPINQTFNFTGSITSWTVPSGVTEITIQADGASGGDVTVNGCYGTLNTGGLGASMTGTFSVTPGNNLLFLVGEKGKDYTAPTCNIGEINWGATGGGGTFVVMDVNNSGTPDAGDTPLIIAGGGGGASIYNFNGFPGLTTESGGNSGSVSGGINGNGGAISMDNNGCGGNGAGGGGFYTNGASADADGGGGIAFLNGGAGGSIPGISGFATNVVYCTGQNFGGFGGGALGGNTGGGGGGYSGGAGGYGLVAAGGGGGSYNNGSAQNNLAGINSGHGKINLSYIASSTTISQIAGLPSGSIFPVGTTTNTFVATDAAGNTDTCSFNITVTDTELPVITCPTNTTLSTDSGVCTYTISSTTSTVTQTYYISLAQLFNLTNNCGSTNSYHNNSGSSSGFDWLDTGSGNATMVEVKFSVGVECWGYLRSTQLNGFNESDFQTPSWCNCDNSSAPNNIVTLMLNPANYIVGGTNSFRIINTSDAWGLIPDALLSGNYAEVNVTYETTNLNPTFSDNCPGSSISYVLSGATTASGNDSLTGITLNQGITTVLWTVTDAYSNSNSCSFDINVIDNEAPSITCAPYQTQTADPGLCQTFVTVVPPTVNDNCGVDTVYNDYTLSPDASDVYIVGTTAVTWTVIDIHGNISTCVQNITVTDDEIPSITCASAQTQTNDPGNCSAYVTVVPPTTNDNCGVDFVYNDYNFTSDASDIYPVGITTVTWTVTDVNGNTNTCTQDIEVTDDEAPVINCPFAPYGIVRPADPGVCFATISVPSPLVSDNCGIASVINDFNGTSDASDDYPVGITTVTWTITDIHGNSSTCQDYVYVIDNQLPVSQTQDITVYLNTNGFVAINPQDINNGSSDNCTIINWNLSQSYFGCDDIGPNTVSLTVTDASGNQSTSTAVVTVLDTISPVVFCNNISITLDAGGNASLTPDLLFNGVYEVCGVSNMNVSPNSFTCSEVGPNMVTLSVEDVNGNIGTCNAIVTVIDNIPPIALCQDITIPLNFMGNATITASQINNGSSDVCGIASLSVFPNTFDCGNVGANIVTLTVTDVNGNTSTCNSIVTIEDVTSPWAFCRDVTVILDATGNATISPDTLDNGSFDECGYLSFSSSMTHFTCANTGQNTVILTVFDYSGNNASCMSTVTVIDNTLPLAICHNITIPLDASGHASITPSQIDNGSTDACGIVSMSVMPNSFTCANIGNNNVVLSVTDDNGNVSTCNAVVTVLDTIPPVAICQNIVVQLDDFGFVTLTGADVGFTSHDACGIASISVTPDTFTCAEIGDNTVTVTVTDVNGNISTCSSVVTIEDITAPDAICQNITVYLDPSGNAAITPDQIDGGSYDPCGIASLNANPSVFSCANIGSNFIFLTATDNSGNIDVCMATVTVLDNTAPVALCHDLTIQLDGTGNASITAAQIDNGSWDACGIASFSISPSTFNCYNVGANTVTLTVTDNNGNISTCTSTVTVQDIIPPMALCQNITIQLDVNGNASITPAQINNGSSDECGIALLVIQPDSFTCSNIGANLVTLTVTDNNGNTSTCSATVTVQDNIAPVAICHNIIAQLDATGNVTINGSQVDNGSHDACGIASLVVAPNTFTCANVGTNAVTLTVTDNNGNVSTCSATVTVEDNVPPVAICQNITIYLDQTGHTSIIPSDIDNGSWDACGIASLSVLPNQFTCAQTGSNVVTLTVTDVNGNISTCISELTVADTIPPTVICPSDVTVNSAPGACDYSGVALGYPLYVDNCAISGVINNGLTSFTIGLTPVIWTVSDAAGNNTSCVQNVFVQSAPLAVNDTVNTPEDTPIIIPVLANDIDCSNDLNTASVIVVTPPANGFTTVDPTTGNITYTPDYLFTGNDEFDYQVCDSTGLCASATVYISVTPVNNPVLGIAKAVTAVTRQGDNSFNISYTITVENLGNDKIENIQVTDDLAAIFQTPVIFTIVDPPNTNNNLTPNVLFNGNGDINLLENTMSYLDIGAVGTITFTINVQISGSIQTFCNTATATGNGSVHGIAVEDISDNGYISDVNGNIYPGDPDENDCTPVTLIPYEVFIPQAFSPDADGKNDFLVIDGIELYPDNEFTIFNRWGNVVYNMKRYDNSWDGIANQKLDLGSKKLPTGTYYYVFDYNKDDRPPKKGFIVIKY